MINYPDGFYWYIEPHAIQPIEIDGGAAYFIGSDEPETLASILLVGRLEPITEYKYPGE